MQMGVLSSLKYTADNAKQFVENFWLKSSRSVERGKTEAPYAWVIPHESEQARPLGTVFMVNLLMDMGIEVHQSDEALSEDDLEALAGSYIVRLDQPYRTLVQVMLDKQNFPDGANAPYDDTGWTLPLMHRVDATRVDSSWVLEAAMTLMETHIVRYGDVEGRGKWLILDNTTDDAVAVFRYKLAGTEMEITESRFEAGDNGEPEYRGTLIEEPYHMSFPFVFEFEGELYMVPETFEAREISLYRCTQFPDGWERCGSLMDDVETSDTMIFQHERRWWMLTNLRPGGALDFYSRLYLFWSNDPISKDWTPHPLNPVVIDAEGGRNGGILLRDSKAPCRIGQLQRIMAYGADWTIFHVDELSDSEYSEHPLTDIRPPQNGNVIGGHHVHSTPSWKALDILKLS